MLVRLHPSVAVASARGLLETVVPVVAETGTVTAALVSTTHPSYTRLVQYGLALRDGRDARNLAHYC